MRSAVITLVSGRHEHLKLQRQGLLAGVLRPDLHVIVTMNDPSAREVLDTRSPRPDVIEMTRHPDRLPLARARNLGAGRALAAGAELLIFLDVDCVPGPQLVRRYTDCATGGLPPSLLCGPVSYLGPPPVTGYVLASLPSSGRPHPARPVPPEGAVLASGDHTLFWSLSFAVTAALWQELGGFCEQYDGYGGEDTDFGQVAASHDVGLTWVGGAWAYHQYHAAPDPPVQHLHDILRNAQIFHQRWGWWPMSGWLRAFQQSGLIRFDHDARTWAAVNS
ncbi:MAG: glycosyltransferase family 2 protein [Actinomycetota bacterium]